MIRPLRSRLLRGVLPSGLLPVAILAVCLAGSFSSLVPAAEVGLEDAALASIREGDLVGHVAFLASDELEGRGLGTPGGRITHRYLASYYARLGFIPMGDDGTFLQAFDARGREGRNVVALLQGTDPTLRDEIVVLGGHLDHLGRGRGEDGPIYNGADDNASGTACLMEVAEAFTIDPPRRSVLFVHFDGEESGLLGSRHFVENPTVPLERIVAMLNTDMVGRSENGYLFVGGVGTASEFADLVPRSNRAFHLALELGEGGRAPSDSTSFYGKGIPVLFFFTNVHEDYHRPTDDWDRLNYPDFARIARFVFTVAAEIANADARPEFRKADGMALPESFGSRIQARAPRARPSRPRLGIRLGEEAGASGALVESVGEDTPAAAAGMRAGDRIVEIGGKVVETPRDLFSWLAGSSFGATVTVKVFRDGTALDLEVTFPAPPEPPPSDEGAPPPADAAANAKAKES